MSKIKNILTIVTIISLLVGIFSTLWGIYEKREKERYKENYQIAVEKTTEYIDKNGILVKEVHKLNLSINDLKKSKDSTIRKLMIELANNNKKLRELEAINYITLQNKNKLTTKSKYLDSVIVNYKTIDSLNIVTLFDTVNIEIDEYSDKWINYKRKKIGDSNYVEIKTNHEIVFFENWQRPKKGFKGFWLWRFLNKKEYVANVKDLNPYSEIKDVKVIKIRKNKLFGKKINE